MLLAAPPSSWQAVALQPVQTSVGAVPAGTYEAAGREYFTSLLTQTGAKIQTKGSTAAKGVDTEAERLKKLVLDKGIEIGDYYSLLGLQAEMFAATTEQVKKNYKKVSVILHPDKAESPEERVYAEERFQSMKKGYETLIDPVLRRKYDSTLPFDESAPKLSKNPTDAEFFKVFPPVFARNARFSIVKPIPQFGDSKTPWDDVNDMYDFWFDFKSWRDFSYLDKHSLDSADGREEKRWMERENKKLRSGKKKEESARVRQFVELAFKSDPRVKAFKEKDAAVKAAKKNAKSGAKKAKEDAENALKAAAEKDAAEKAVTDKAAKKQAKFLKDQMKKARSRLRKLCMAHFLSDLPEDDVEKLCKGCTVQELNGLVKTLKGGELEKGMADMKAFLAALESGESAAIAAKEAERVRMLAEEKKKLEAAAKKNAWNQEELDQLISGQKRFNKNWGKITDMVNNVSTKTWKIKDIIAKVDELHKAKK